MFTTQREAEMKTLAQLLKERDDLLASLEECFPILLDLDSQREDDDEEMPLIARARAAIAKAKGE